MFDQTSVEKRNGGRGREGKGTVELREKTLKLQTKRKLELHQLQI